MSLSTDSLKHIKNNCNELIAANSFALLRELIDYLQAPNRKRAPNKQRKNKTVGSILLDRLILKRNV